MTDTLIFDLSEVLIAGLLGIEKPLADLLQVEEMSILLAFSGQRLQDLCCGLLTEDDYIGQILHEQGWDISPDEVKQIIRSNFHHRVAGMDTLVEHLVKRYELVLLSDHAQEWIVYIQGIHSFLALFPVQIFSFELGQTKRQVPTFEKMLARIDRRPEQCLFVDDSALNIEVATSVGIQGLRFTTAHALVDELVGRNLLASDFSLVGL